VQQRSRVGEKLDVDNHGEEIYALVIEIRDEPIIRCEPKIWLHYATRSKRMERRSRASRPSGEARSAFLIVRS
jgi:hypothetical protein